MEIGVGTANAAHPGETRWRNRQFRPIRNGIAE